MSEKIHVLPHDHGQDIRKLLASYPDAGVFSGAADTFALLADSTRVKILWLLCHCEECVSNIAAAIDMSPPAVSHHLRVLRSAGLLVSRREGKEAYYTLSDSDEAQLVHRIVDDVFDINCR